MNIFTKLYDLITGKDNQTLDLGRVSWLISIITVIGHSCWAAYNKVAVDLFQLATALSAVAAAHGVALGFKAGTEPDSK
jgi:hypothetical protein